MVVVGCAAQSAMVGTVNKVSGTSELIICKRAYSFSEPENVVATADVVLFDRMMT
jgi:hypothetical protein